MAALDTASRKTLIAGLQVATGSQWPDHAAGLDPAIAHFNTYGYTISLGEWHPDINAIAVPIVMPDGDIYSMNCGGPAFKLPDTFLRETVAPGLMACVETIAAESGASMHALDSQSRRR
ncbi:hypothetical protein [Cupriavidus sp. CP313]